MLRIISLFLLLIISRISFSETIPATLVNGSITLASLTNAWVINGTSWEGKTLYSSAESGCSSYLASLISSDPKYYDGGSSYYNTAVKYYCHIKYTTVSRSVYFYYTTTARNCSSGYLSTSDGTASSSGTYCRTPDTYSCSSGYTQSDSAGNADSTGTYCTKNSCQDLYQTTSMIDIPPRQTVTNACFNGCSASSMLGTWVCDSDTACSIRVSFDGNSCSGGVDFSANASNSSGSNGDTSGGTSDGCGTAGSTTGTVNGETVTTCADDGTDSPPLTDTSSGSPPITSGAGSTVGDPGNTSGTQTGTVGGGTGGLGGEGYGEGGSSGGTSGGDTSGGTSGGDTSGGTSGGDTSGGTSGGDTSGGTSGGDTSGGTSGGDTSGGSSGSGGGSDTGTGAAASGAGDTDSDTPAEEEEESGDGGGTFAAPGEGTDYLKDVFGESDLDSLASDNAELTTKINQKMSDVKGIFNLGTLSVSGDMPENQQEIKGASVDLSGRNIFEQLSIVAAAFYLCAIATAIYIVMGGRK